MKTLKLLSITYSWEKKRKERGKEIDLHDSSCASISCHLNARNAWVSLCTYHRKKQSAMWSQSAIKEKLLTFNVSNGASIVLFPLYIFPSPQVDYSVAEEILFLAVS